MLPAIGPPRYFSWGAGATLAGRSRPVQAIRKDWIQGTFFRHQKTGLWEQGARADRCMGYMARGMELAQSVGDTALRQLGYFEVIF